MKYHYLHVIVPQGEAPNPKKEDLFQQVLVNLQNTVKDKVVSLEFFGYEQYTYCYMAVPDDLLETIQGLIYSTFPDAEIKPTKDYAIMFEPEKHGIAGTTLDFKFFDIYPLKTYEQFTEDSQSGLFSVISKIASNEQVWVQIVIRPKNETAGYHFKRNWNMRFARWRQVFHIRDWFRAKSDESIRVKRGKLAQEKFKEPPYDMVVRCAYIAKDTPTAKRKLNAVINSFYQFNSTDIQEFVASRISTSPHTEADDRAYVTEYGFLDDVNQLTHILMGDCQAQVVLTGFGEDFGERVSREILEFVDIEIKITSLFLAHICALHRRLIDLCDDHSS